MSTKTVNQNQHNIKQEAAKNDNSIYGLILSDIAKGTWVSGDRLVTTKLAKLYGTSINPVREALKLLQGEGFVTVSPNSGTRVTKFEFQTMRDVFEVLELLEPYLIKWFVLNHSAQQLAELYTILADMKALHPSEYMRYRELDKSFHGIMYCQHYNKRVVTLWQKNSLMLQAFHSNMAFSIARFEQSIIEHQQMLISIEARDAKTTLTLLNQHITNSGQYWSQHFH